MADFVNCDPFVFIENDWIDAATGGSVGVDVASAILSIVEYAVSLAVAEHRIAVFVHSDKGVFAVALFFKACDIFFREKHVGLLAADSASEAAHDGRVVLVLFVLFSVLVGDVH